MQKLKKRFMQAIANIETTEEDFAALLDSVSTNHVKEGSVVKGQVVGVEKEVVIVDVGLKNEGRVLKSEFISPEQKSLPEVGDIVDVYVEKIEGRNGKTILSREKAIREKSWDVLEAACSSGQFVNGIIFGRVKGGFTVDISGVVAFLPGSQVDVRPIKDMSTLMNISQQFQILKMDKKLGNIVVSRRAILEESRSEARDEMLSTITEGMILEGYVKNITDYGAFIDLGSIDGLLHVTDISWSRINHPSEILSLGQKIKVMVIKFNEEAKRISLGMKQLDDNPWQNIKNEFPVGKIFTGKVSNITDYGAFVELKDGIEGLIHSTEISWIKSNQHPKKLLTIGQEVEFVILEIDTIKHRISLSIKQCQENPLTNFAAKHPIGSIITSPIRNITDFGIFVALDSNMDGLIHESDISWDGNGTELLKNYTKDQVISCKLLAIDTEKERISLSIKHLTAEPKVDDEFAKLKKDDVITCTVTNVNDDAIEVGIYDTIHGTIKKGDLSSIKADQKPEKFVVGDRVDAKIISVNKQSRKVTLSIKALEIAERNKAIKDYGSVDSGASLGDILGGALEKGK